VFECEQCRVWGYDLAPMTQEEAELHLLHVHPPRFYRLYRLLLNAAMVDDRHQLVSDLRDTLRARRE